MRDGCFPVAVPPHVVPAPVQAAFPRRTPLRIQAARIGGVEVPNQKYVEYSLQYIFGIGHTTAKAILVTTGVENKRTKVRDPRSPFGSLLQQMLAGN